MRETVGLLVLGMFLAGCATMSEDECRSANWEQTGYRDGARGVPETRMGSRAEACAEFSVELDRDAYMAGYERGLVLYCRPENAVRVAFDGGSYSGVCPPDSHGEFLRVFEAAQNVQALRARFDYLRDQQHQLEYRLDEASSEDEQRALRYQLSRLDDEMRLQRERLFYAEENLRRVVNGARTWP